MKVGRNEPCPCDSGKKFKQCCEKTGTKSHRAWNYLLLLVALLMIAGAALAVYSAATAEKTDPPGKIWSEEHGHWHDAPVSAGLPPLGDPPPGKVWSDEHGHWHDAPAGAAVRPEGDPPPGKIWSDEHGHWHDTLADGTDSGSSSN
ncbi:MAG: SEC-C metal-binding domain-containing protein, partial [Gemmatimonadetes bacterium]|nr:SEC-C metal-binding domain-containing protein [Gemmatimonadota bacterium]